MDSYIIISAPIASEQVPVNYEDPPGGGTSTQCVVA